MVLNNNNNYKDTSEDANKIYASHHTSEFDSNLLNKAMEKAINNKDFLNSSLNLIKDINFPTFKTKIINAVKNSTNDLTTIALFYTLSDTLEYRDITQIKNILESNIPAKNSAHNTKTPDKLNVNPLSSPQKMSNVKEKDPLSSDSMREYTCNKCGKPFFTREDLRIHQEFEGK